MPRAETSGGLHFQPKTVPAYPIQLTWTRARFQRNMVVDHDNTSWHNNVKAMCICSYRDKGEMWRCNGLLVTLIPILLNHSAIQIWNSKIYLPIWSNFDLAYPWCSHPISANFLSGQYAPTDQSCCTGPWQILGIFILQKMHVAARK